MGPGQNPQYTGAVQRREAVGCSQGLKISPQNQHGSGANINMVAERQLQFHSQPASSVQYVTTECADVPDVSIEERKDGLSSRNVTRSTVTVQA